MSRRRGASPGRGSRLLRLSAASLIAALLVPALAAAQVLGACGTPAEEKPAEAAKGAEAGAALVNQPTPLPGMRATNFELTAVVGDEIRPVKLSDYNGSWRVVCFYPGDFTFV